MASIPSTVKIALQACATVSVVIGGIAVTAPQAFAEGTYPPGWNVESHVPPSQYHFIPSWGDSKAYWRDQKWPGNNASRYSADQCRWGWCRSVTNKLGTATAQNPTPAAGH
jgi:hypothetical protein